MIDGMQRLRLRPEERSTTFGRQLQAELYSEHSLYSSHPYVVGF